LKLVDKSDKLKQAFNGGLLELAQQYRVQMDLYTEALEQITGKPVKERILYFLSANQAINV
jgi:ATP-dependent exoDNAse (exonuclease V) beta subunit